VFRYYRIMALTYPDIGMTIFGEDSFTVAEFGRRTGTRRAAKTLSELKTRGFVERTGRGSYRFLRPSERPDLREAEWARVRSLILRGPDPKAWSGPTAVELWTAGNYTLSSSPYGRTFHVAIPRSSAKEWEGYLGKHGISLHPRKRIGARVLLEPTDDLSYELLGGEPVLSRNEVVRLVREHPTLYADAEDALINRPR
jgi:hypothetical protein